MNNNNEVEVNKSDDFVAETGLNKMEGVDESLGPIFNSEAIAINSHVPVLPVNMSVALPSTSLPSLAVNLNDVVAFNQVKPYGGEHETTLAVFSIL